MAEQLAIEEVQGPTEQQEQQEPQAPQGPQGPQLPNAIDPAKFKDVDPQFKKKVEMANNMITDMMYHPETKAHIQSMLKGAPPEMSIPATTNAVYRRFEDMSSQANRGRPPLSVALATGVHTFAEVMELAEEMKIVPPDITDDEVQPLLKETMQQYIQKGLKEKSIDPIELQQEVEPLLSDQEREIASHFQKATGVPEQLTGAQATEALFQKREAPLKVERENLKQQNQNMQQALQGVASMPKEPEGGSR